MCFSPDASLLSTSVRGNASRLGDSLQASVLLNARAQSAGRDQLFWHWEHAVCCMVADYWNIPTEFRVGHCYYSDWGSPPKNWSDDTVDFSEAILARASERIGYAMGQIGR